MGATRLSLSLSLRGPGPEGERLDGRPLVGPLVWQVAPVGAWRRSQRGRQPIGSPKEQDGPAKRQAFQLIWK
ncbi:MAG: hypothetical protein ACK587_13155 [Cyanobacteriota bacterium]